MDEARLAIALRESLRSTARWCRIIAGCAAVWAAGTAVLAEEGKPLEPVTLQLKWVHQFQFAGYYAAEAKGFYQEEGLAVKIIEGGATRPPIPTVLGGGADFGVSDSELVLARMKGQPVKVCAAIFQHSPYVIISLKESGIRSPKDLRGKSVMLEEDQGAAQFRGMLIREGIPLQDVKIVKHSWDITDLLERRVDAISGYAMVEPVRLKARGVESALMHALDYGVDFYGDTLFTTEAQVRNHPKRVEKFVRASIRGWEYAMEHPEEIAVLIAGMKGVAQRGDTREIILEHARGMRDYILPDVVEIGHMNPGRWEQIARVFAETGMAPKKWSLHGFVFDPHPHMDAVLLRRIAILGACGLGLIVLALLWNVQMRRQVRLQTEELRVEVSQRKRAEEEARTAERRLQAGLDAGGIGTWEWDLQASRIKWAGFHEELWGMKPGTFGGTPDEFEQRLHPDDLVTVRAKMKELMSNPEPFTYEYRVIWPDGSVHWIFGRGEAVCDEKGQVVKLMGAIRDVTERKQAELALGTQHRFLNDLIENSGSLIYAKDREGRYRLVNRVWEETVGKLREEVLGLTDREIFPGAQGQHFRENDLAVMKMGKSQTFEEVLDSPTGRRFFLSVKFPMLDAAGNITGICGMTTEITHLRQMDEKLRQSEEHFRSVVEQAGEGIFICKPDGHCLSANKTGCEMLGYTEEELHGMTFADITLSDDVPRLAQETEHVLSGGLLQTQWRVRRKDGSIFTCEVNSKLRSDGTLQIFVRDVTEREAAAQRQARLQRTIQTISEANSLIVRATNEDQLLQDFCERMVQQTGHRVIWVGFVDEKTKNVCIAAKAGPAIEYLDGIQLSADENNPSGRGPSGTCIRTGQVVNCRSFARNPDFAPWLERAERCGLRCSISLPLRVDGRVSGVFTLYSDMEDRFDKEEERLLAELADDLAYAIGALRRERWLRIISHAVEHSPATVVITDSEGNIEYVNPKFTQLTGYTAEEALGQNPRILKSGKLTPDDYRQLWQTIKSGHEWQGELLNRKKNGELYWEYAWISPVVDIGGQTTRFIAIKEDITDRKFSEERVRAQLARTGLLNQITRAIGERADLETMLSVVASNLEEHLPVDFSALCLADEGGKKLTVTAMGPRGEKLVAKSGIDDGTRLAIVSEGVERCTHGAVVYEADLGGATGPFATALARLGLGSAVLVPLALKDQIFGVLVAGRGKTQGFSEGDCDFLRQLGEHVALAVHQAQLLSDLQTANAELRTSREAALQQERLRALGTMASGVAHDINNAISPVAIYCDLLIQTEPGLSAESKDFIKTIQHSIQDVAGTVSRLREFYRKRDEQTELFPVAINHVAKEVVKLTRARWVDMPQERGIVIDMNLQLTNALPEVSGVESEIREAVINLVFNAVDAMPSGGKLTIHTGLTEEKPPRVFIEVGDSGVGMDEETRRRCLEPFYTTKGERGTGLGLAMVCGVAQRHDAEITIDSTPGKGTTIRLAFPVPESALLKRAPVEAAVSVPSLRVLVVDDDPLITKALDFGLQVDGHTVVIAGGGQEGIDRFQEAFAKGEPFEAVITDLGMPHVDGRQVAAAVKSASPSTPVILLTGWGQRLIDAGEIPENVDRVLSKPPRLREVREALAACRARGSAK